jgi:hypothetical protein
MNAFLKLKNEPGKKNEQGDSIREDRAPNEDEIVIPNPYSRMAKAIRCRAKLRKSVVGTKTEVLSMKEPKPLTASKRIQNIFQATAPTNTAETVTSGFRIRTAIEEAQKRVSKKDDDHQNENDPSGTPADLHAFYRKYSNNDKVVENNENGSVRAGEKWTAGYGERRRQQRHRHPQKRMLRRTTPFLCGNSVTSAPARMAPTNIDEMGFAAFL